MIRFSMLSKAAQPDRLWFAVNHSRRSARESGCVEFGGAATMRAVSGVAFALCCGGSSYDAFIRRGEQFVVGFIS